MSDKQTAVAEAADPARVQPATAPIGDRARRRGSVSGGLALILALIALALSGYLWYTLAERQRLLGADIVGQLRTLTQANAQAQQQQAAVAQRLAGLQETQDAFKSAIGSLSSEIGRNRRDWVLSETEQLLVIANERLQLARDVTLALAALRAADRHLQQLANPNLLPVRRVLAADINRLESANQVDIPGMALTLNNLATRVEQLPLISELHSEKSTATTAASAPPVVGWRGVLHEMWADLSSLIRIRNDAAPAQPMLPPNQAYFLRENLRLVLLGAQLALLEHEPEVYAQDLKTAQAWLDRYFEHDAPLVAKTRDEIATLRQATGKMQVPDISASLQALQRAITVRETP